MTSAATRSVPRAVAFWVALPMVLATIVQLTQSLYHRAGSHMLDMEVYRAGVNAMLAGDSPYSVVVGAEQLLFTYPPFSLFVLLPLGPLDLDVVAWSWTAIGIAALQVAVVLALRTTRVRRVWTVTLAVVPLALLYNPVDQTLQWGQISLVLLAMVLIDLRLPDGSRVKGVLTGIAAGIKIFPGLFVLYHLCTGRRRAAGTLVGTAIGTLVLAWLVFPGYSKEYWLDDVLDTSRIAPTGWVPNESMRAMLARVLHSEETALVPWLVLSLAAVALAAATARWAHRAGEERLGLVAIALAVLLVSPVSWHHYWVWSIPVGIYLADIARRANSRFLLVCAVVPIAVIALRVNEWVIPAPPYDPLALDPLPLVTTSIVTYVTILLLAAVSAYTWTLRTRPRAPRVDDSRAEAVR